MTDQFSFKWTVTAGIGIHPDWWISKMQSGREEILEERYAKKFCFKLEKQMPQKRLECFRLLLEHLAWIEHQFFSGIKDSRKAGSLWGMMRGVGGVRKSVDQSWLAKGLGLGLLCWGFKGVSSGRDSLGRDQHYSNRVSGISTRTMHQSTTTYLWQNIWPRWTSRQFLTPYSPDLSPSDFWLFPKLWGCRYEATEEVKRGVTKVIDTLKQEDFHGTFQKLLERYNKCIAAGGD